MMRFPFSKILCFLTIVVTSVVVFSCTDHRFPPEEPDAAETVYVGDFNNLYAFDANSGTKKWEVPIAHVRRSGPTVANGIVYMSSGVNLIAVDAATGIKKWDVPIGDQDQFGYVDFIPSVVNDIVYVSVSGFINKVYALDAATGTKKWDFSTGGFDITGPTVRNGVVYVGIRQKLLAIDALSGIKKWEVTDLSGIPTNPSVVDGIVYTNFGTKLYAHDAITGAQKWASDAAGTGCPTLENGLIYLKGSGGSIGALYVINATTGQYIREYDFIWEGRSNPVVFNGIVYVGSGGTILGEGSTFHAIDASTASKKWTRKFEFDTSSSPTVADGTVFFGTTGLSSKLYGLDALTGTIKWEISPSLNTNMFTPACVVTKKGVVYHASDSGDQQ